MDDGLNEQQRAEAEHQILARSGRLQQRLLGILNDPADAWVLQPCIAAHAFAETLGNILVHVVGLDASKQRWALELLDHIRERATDAAKAGVGSGRRQH